MNEATVRVGFLSFFQEFDASSSESYNDASKAHQYCAVIGKVYRKFASINHINNGMTKEKRKKKKSKKLRGKR